MSLPTENHWTFDKRVPLALVFTIVVQTGCFVWWAATASASLAQVVKDTVALSERVARVEMIGPPLSERLIRVETILSTQQDVLQQILSEVRRSPNE